MPLAEPPKRPDPAIYSQELAIARGQIPTWDSGDLYCLWVGGEWQQEQGGQSSQFFPTLIAKPRNLGEAQAINTSVRAWRSEFGLGMPRIPLANGMVSLPPGAAGEARIPIPEDFPQHFMSPPGLHVELEHPHDKDRGNNRCSYNVTRVRIEDGATRNLVIACPVENPTAAPVTYQLAFYTSPGLTASAPASVTVAPNERQMLPISIVVASDIHGGPQAVSLEATLMAVAPGIVDGATWNILVFD